MTTDQMFAAVQSCAWSTEATQLLVCPKGGRAVGFRSCVAIAVLLLLLLLILLYVLLLLLLLFLLWLFACVYDLLAGLTFSQNRLFLAVCRRLNEV